MRSCALSTAPATKQLAVLRNTLRAAPAGAQGFEAVFAAHNAEPETTSATGKERKRAEHASVAPELAAGTGVEVIPEANVPSPAQPEVVESGGKNAGVNPLPQIDVAGDSEDARGEGLSSSPGPGGSPGNIRTPKPVFDPPPAPLPTEEALTDKGVRPQVAPVVDTDVPAPPGEAQPAPEVGPATSVHKLTLREPELPEQANTDGTAAAQQEPAMDLAQQQDENAGGEQTSPDSCLDERKELAIHAGKEGRFTPSDGGSGGMASSGSAPASTVESPEVAADITGRIDLIEHLEYAIESTSSRLQASDEQSVSIVLRPLPGTELLMNVRVVEGRIEAAVELQRGDAAMLGSEWPQLQQRLERQGVHLAELLHSRGFGSGSHHRREQSRPEATDWQFAPPSRTSTSERRIKPAAHPVTYFESWA